MPMLSGCDAGNAPRPLSEDADLLHCAGFGDAVAGEDDRALGIANELGCLRQARVFHPQHGMGTISARLGGVKVENGRALLRVFGYVDKHRSGAAGLCNLKCAADGRGNVLGAMDEEVMFSYRQSYAGNVDFLKRIGAEYLR